MAQQPTPQDLLAALRKSAVVIQKQEQELAAYHEPLAIIGMGCRYPGAADTPERFWQNLLAGVDGIGPLPNQRAKDLYGYSTDELFASVQQSAAAALAAHALRGGFLERVDGFDPTFFGLSPREVLVMDPAHRLLLETVWQALEDANIVPAALFNTEVGVFIGNGLSGYAQFCEEQEGNLYTATGNTPSTAAGRISYVLGITGPCISLDTACSSSLTAVHLACQSLRNGECSTALAGGVNIILEANSTSLFASGNMLSGEARCKTFDAAADGYVRGEGCGVLVLKRLSDAQANGDRILAVIRGTAVNQDGPSSGLTVPNGPAQERVIRRALADAKLKPEQIGYIEAHGTGTPLGDPIEIGALSAVFGGRSQPLYVGSVKTNVGHLEMAAGVAGLMKLVLALQHGQIPPHLHFHTPNPHIDWAASPVQVPTTVQPWPSATSERIGGVSSFGFSGTNAHVIVSEAPRQEQRTGDWRQETEDKGQGTKDKGQTRHLLTLSAKSPEALQAYAQRYRDFLAAHPDLALGDLCYTSQIGRSHFAHRLGVVGASVAEVSQQLAAYALEPEQAGLCHGIVSTTRHPSKLAFLFTGQGSQSVNMGRDLYTTNPTFRAALDQCEALYQAETGESLLAVMYPEATTDDRRPTTADERSSVVGRQLSLDETTYTQPALFALEVALAQLWQSWGVQPDILIGHSVGEVVAACVAGVFSLADGMKLVAARGRLMGALPQDGAMIAVQIDEAQAQRAIAPVADRVSIAAVNGPNNLVLSGQRDAIDAVVGHLSSVVAADASANRAQGAPAKIRHLTVSHAFHSPLMEPMLDPFRQVVQTITYHAPTIPIVSNVSGKLAGAEVTTADYWVRHVREAVRFADGVTTLQEQGIDLLLEIGPQPTLLGMAEPLVREQGTENRKQKTEDGHLVMLPSLRTNTADWQQMLTSLGMLYVRGRKIDWAGVNQAQPRRKVMLPTYPFQHQRYWATPRKRRQREALRPLLDRRVKLPATRETLFETDVSVTTLPFLADHQVYGAVVAPGACHLALVLSAAEVTFGDGDYAVQDLIFPQALILENGDETRTVQLLCKPVAHQDGGRQLAFQLLSFGENTTEDAPATTLHATGAVGLATTVPAREPTLAALQAHCTEAIAVPLYADDSTAAMHFGPTLRWLDGFWQPVQESGQPFQLLARLRRPAVVENVDGYVIHPGLLDGCFQAAGLAQGWATGTTELHLPFALASAHVSRAATGDTWWCYLMQGGTQWQIHLFDELGQRVALLDGFQLRAAPQAALQATRLCTDWLYTLTWEATALAPSESAYRPDCWLLVGATDALQTALAAHLQRAGCPVITAAPDASLHTVVTELATVHDTVGVLYWGGAAATSPQPAVAEAAYQLCSGLLHLTQALLATALNSRLWVVTADCQLPLSEPSHHTVPALATAAGTLWGMGRTIAQEQPQWQTLCLDLDSSLTVAVQVALLAAELSAPAVNATAAGGVAYRQQSRYLARLAPWQPFDASTPQRLQLQAYGSLEHLHFVPQSRRMPGPGEIEIAVSAAGLNFRDVLNALGMLQEYYAQVLGVTDAQAVGLGFECAGVVTAVGAGVSAFAVGDHVMGLSLGEGAFANYLTLPASGMVAIPAGMSDEEAATLPLVYLTAWYGLVELAKVQAGDRVLIHAAAGGVGQAAVQIAQALGAEVFATASPGKWDWLRQQGVTHLFHSRTLDFAEEIRQQTDGRGVDVVLNSLSGEFIAHSLATLAPGGRFVEIGKLGIWSSEQMAATRPDVAYHAFDLGEALAHDPTLQPRLWQALLPRFQAGTLRPLPHTTFPAQEAVAAFRTMQQAKHRGKVVLRLAAPAPVTINATASYLITGGLGGLGLQVAQQLVTEGARTLVLTGRSGVTSATQQQAIDHLVAAGATVQVIPADIADPQAVQALLAQCNALAPLRGIVHAAGVLDDGVLSAQTPQRLAAVLRPKVDGAWHLHTLTADQPLDFFVCFSSVSSLVGSPGQSTYAAANAFLDTLMQQRRQQGLPGLSINWGPWAEVGMAAALQTRLQQQGLILIAPAQGRLLFAYLLQQSAGTPGQVGILPFQAVPVVAAPQAKRATIRDLLDTLPEQERLLRLEAYVRTEIATVLRLAANTPLNVYTRLFDFGLDSLMAVELKNKLEQQLACTLRPTVIFDYPTLAVLVPHLYHDSLGYQTAPSKESLAPGTQPTGAPQPVANLEALSAAELDDLLEQELALLEE